MRKYVGLTAASAIIATGVTSYWLFAPKVQTEQSMDKMGAERLELGSIRPLELPKDLNLDIAELGKSLFMDPRLSHTGEVSCMSCHAFDKGGTDNRRFSVGINGAVGGINAPSVFNAVFNFRQFWDGRAEDLVQQAGGPVENPLEMGSSWPEVLSKLNADSRMVERFRSVFHEEPTQSNVTVALAEFERALVTMNAPFDRYLRGEKTALSEAQVRGYRRFTEYGCVSCHQGQNVGGNMFQQMGVAYDYFRERGGTLDADQGRYRVTKVQADMHVFKVPSLRNVELTAPYFHDGSEPALDKAVRKMARYQLGRVLPDQDVNDIVEFLRSLTGETPAILKGISHDVAKE